MIGAWFRRMRLRRKARRLLNEVFAKPDGLEGTSLRPSHRSRIDLMDMEVDGDQIHTIDFLILRHPRPHPFSRQFHEVMQRYRYDVREGKISHVKSLNLSRLEGRDGEPPGGGGI